MKEKAFLHGFLAALALLGIVLGILDMYFSKVGEIGLQGVVSRQLRDEAPVLFSSGLNQHAYRYKIMLFEAVRPRVIAIGSSRAMQVRGSFFKDSFMNLGGATNNIAELELLANYLSSLKAARPQLAIVFFDPWWLNARYPENIGSRITDFPKVVSADMLMFAASALRHGNWIAKSLQSKNLGIYSILLDQGYSKDGSYHYGGTISGRNPSNDVDFGDTFARIDGDRDRFEKNDRPDPELIRKACAALATIKRSVGHIVIIAPPFTTRVWNKMMSGGYDYVAKGYTGLHACTSDVAFFDFVDPAAIGGSSDCEFVDGLHGGDTTYARMIRQVGSEDPETRRYLDTEFIDGFINKYSGYAGGMTLSMFKDLKEIDFLKLGCKK